MTLNIAILFSGEGTTLQNLIDATRDGRLPGVTVVKAVSSRENAGGIARCAAAGVPCVVVAKKDYPDPADHTRAVFAGLPPDKVDLVCLAGWMSRLVLDRPWLDDRVMNVHPSLLPAFGGPGMYGRSRPRRRSGPRLQGHGLHRPLRQQRGRRRADHQSTLRSSRLRKRPAAARRARPSGGAASLRRLNKKLRILLTPLGSGVSSCYRYINDAHFTRPHASDLRR